MRESKSFFGCMRLFSRMIMMLFPVFASAQTLTLEQAYELAKQNYPLTKQKDLVRQTADITIENLNKGYLPQIVVSGQATLQSDVTRPTIPTPGFLIQIQDKDQYKVIVADLNQVIYDGGMIKNQKEFQKLNAEVENQKVEVELYKLLERVNQVFLSVLYIEEQIKQVQLLKEDLNNGIKNVQAQVNNGVAFRSNLNVLRAELLRNDQRVIELNATRKGLVDVLALLINQPLPENAGLATPHPMQLVSNELKRPEIKLFSDQSKLLMQ